MVPPTNARSAVRGTHAEACNIARVPCARNRRLDRRWETRLGVRLDLQLPARETSGRPPAAQLLEFLEGLGPVLLHQRGQAPVGQEAPAALALRAVVALVVRVADALYGRTAVGAWLAEAAVHGHALAERGDLVGEAFAHLVAQTRGPFVQHRHGRRSQPFDFGVVEA